MTSDNTPTKKEPAAKAAATPSTPSTPSEGAAKSGGSEKANYSRGEGQKPVTDAYKENWNAIFAKKKPKRRK